MADRSLAVRKSSWHRGHQHYMWRRKGKWFKGEPCVSRKNISRRLWEAAEDADRRA